MNLASMSPVDLVGALLGLFFTLSIFSYLLGDNALFRLAIHIFIGVAAGFTAILVVYNVIWPQLLLPLIFGERSERLFVIVPLVLGGLLLTKASPRLAGVGSWPMAYLVGVGMAAAVGGAVLGTLFPQVNASINLFDWGLAQQSGANPLVQFAVGGVILLGTLSTLIYFQFSARDRQDQAPRRSQIVEAIAFIGQFFIAITFGALFAGVYAAALTAMIERWYFILQLLLPFVSSQ